MLAVVLLLSLVHGFGRSFTAFWENCYWALCVVFVVKKKATLGVTFVLCLVVVLVSMRFFAGFEGDGLGDEVVAVAVVFVVVRPAVYFRNFA